MRLLILGGKGMAGHMMVSYFKKRSSIDVYYTSRDSHNQDPRHIPLDVRDDTKLSTVVEQLKPDVVINAVGLLNDAATNHVVDAIQINSLLPHKLADLVDTIDGKLIHISTDCVFSGQKGDYTEADPTDGSSTYAKTKSLGEVTYGKHLTIRTSIIGPELKEDGIGLFLWFMKQTGEIYGYQNVFWNGVTTLQLAKAIEVCIEKNYTGLYHLCAETKISKYDLLILLQTIFQKQEVTIVPDNQIQLDRSIQNTRSDISFSIPSYEEMLTELKEWMKENG
jgi:dTDP-4-dehydrorhamnose reductase